MDDVQVYPWNGVGFLCEYEWGFYSRCMNLATHDEGRRCAKHSIARRFNYGFDQFGVNPENFS